MVNRLNLLLAGTVLAVASGSAAAHGRVSFGISLGVPVAPVYVAPAPVYYAPPPVVYVPPAPVYYGTYYGAAPVYYNRPNWSHHHHGHHGNHRNWK